MDSATGDNSSMSTCAACGKAGNSLKACTSCKQVKYCNRNCQKLHWPKHKKECKQLAAEGDNKSSDKSISEGIDSINLSDSIPASTTAADKKMNTSCREKQKMVHVKNHDDKLFEEPPPKEECPICLLPMPYANKEVCEVGLTYMPCCGKHLCRGCVLAASEEMAKGNMKACCPFCRMPIPKSDDEYIQRIKKRMKLNDSEAFYDLGGLFYRGGMGLPIDMSKAFELWHRAAELGSINAHYNLADIYYHGEGVKKDIETAVHHLEVAAIGGNEQARHNLGVKEYRNGNMELACKHVMISARCGYDEALKKVGEMYKRGYVTKEEYTNTLRTYQQCTIEMKSEQRTKAAAKK